MRAGLARAIFSTGFAQAFATHRVYQLTYIMTDEDERELQAELARLQQEHRDLDAAIDALHQSPAPDLLRLQRLKKGTAMAETMLCKATERVRVAAGRAYLRGRG